MKYLAHSANQSGEGHGLAEHLAEVAKLASEFASAFGAGKEASCLGLLHDLGKYGDKFQARLQGKEKGIDHWTAGALQAFSMLQSNGLGVVLAILGHHLGLPAADQTCVSGLLSGSAAGHWKPSQDAAAGGLETLVERWQEELGGQEVVLEKSMYSHHGSCAAGLLDLRMLFSCLVDADYLDTEAHFQGPRPEAPPLNPEQALALLQKHLEKLSSQSGSACEVQALRDDLRQACLKAADCAPGLFTLTAPTGAGKTLSLLAFALRHAVVHGLRRIVVVIPYLTIVEQTVRTYRDVLGTLDTGPAPYLLEHHSLAADGQGEEDDDCDPRRLMAQNWDAPIIITTSVQCLESLFAHQPGRCRKLHRLARSVILFDEVQTLPDHLAIPTLATLSHLASRYGTSIVFSTATQPAFGHLSASVKELGGCDWSPLAIVPQELKLFERAKRVQAHWPTKESEVTTWSEIAEQVGEHPQVLCVVNMKRHAWALLDELQKQGAGGLLHLSTSMCPAHREAVLNEVRGRLEAGQPCTLVATQCVEAGVDLDFPVAFRAWGPLDSIAQVAGRCNRNGLLAGLGNLHVFIAPADGHFPYPDGAYQQAADKARSLLQEYMAEGKTLDLDDPQIYQRYYKDLYELQGLAQCSAQSDKLLGYMKTRHLPKVAKHYRLIEQAAINVLVPYSPQEHVFSQLKQEAEAGGFDRDWVRKARPLTVNLYRPGQNSPAWQALQAIELKQAGGGHKACTDWFIYTRKEDYDDLRGLVVVPEWQVLIA